MLDLMSTNVLAFDGDASPGSSPGQLAIVAPASLAVGTNAIVRIELAGSATAGTDRDQLRPPTPRARWAARAVKPGTSLDWRCCGLCQGVAVEHAVAPRGHPAR
jgi:hypothetical protein